MKEWTHRARCQNMLFDYKNKNKDQNNLRRLANWWVEKKNKPCA